MLLTPRPHASSSRRRLLRIAGVGHREWHRAAAPRGSWLSPRRALSTARTGCGAARARALPPHHGWLAGLALRCPPRQRPCRIACWGVRRRAALPRRGLHGPRPPRAPPRRRGATAPAPANECPAQRPRLTCPRPRFSSTLHPSPLPRPRIARTGALPAALRDWLAVPPIPPVTRHGRPVARRSGGGSGRL